MTTGEDIEAEFVRLASKVSINNHLDENFLSMLIIIIHKFVHRAKVIRTLQLMIYLWNKALRIEVKKTTTELEPLTSRGIEKKRSIIVYGVSRIISYKNI